MSSVREISFRLSLMMSCICHLLLSTYSTSLQGWKCQVQVMADSLSFQDPAAGRRDLRHKRRDLWNNGIKVISASSALLS